MTTEVLVKLAARDPWSFTVLDALKRKFGIGAIRGVERLKSWRLDFEVESDIAASSSRADFSPPSFSSVSSDLALYSPRPEDFENMHVGSDISRTKRSSITEMNLIKRIGSFGQTSWGKL